MNKQTVYNFLSLVFAVLFAIILILAFVSTAGCKEPSGSTDPAPPAPPEPVPPENTTTGPVLYALFDGDKLMYCDGNETVIAYHDDNINYAGNKSCSIGDVLYHFDSYGQPVLTEWLPVEPDAIKIKPSSGPPASIMRGLGAAIVYQDEVWTIEDINPAEAMALGGQPKHYTKIYKNEELVSDWFENEWKIKKVIKPVAGTIIAIDTNGAYHNLETADDIFFAKDDDLIIHTRNLTGKTAKFHTDGGTFDVSWTYNFFNNAQWLLVDGIWHSHNGYTYTDAGGLQEQSTEMWDWNQYPYPVQDVYGEAPYLIPAGTRTENSIEVIYWIECNTGTLIRYRPGFDVIDILPRLYVSDGMRLTGIAKAEVLEPELIGANIFYHNSGTLWKYNITTQIIEAVGGDMELFVW